MASYDKKRMPIWIRIIVSLFFSLLAIAVLYVGIQLMDLTKVYRASEGVTEFPVLDEVSVTEIQDGWDVRKGALLAPDGWYFDGPGEDKAFVFYPGKCVDAAAYQPLMHSLAENGIDCFLIKPLISFPPLYKDVAAYIMDAYADTYTTWYVGGHDQGGETAAAFASEHLTELGGLVLLGAYPTTSLRYGAFRVLSIYGTKDTVIDVEKFVAGREYMPGNYREVPIEGGNHSYFGIYGLEEGDDPGTITNADQQQKTLTEILGFMQ